MEPNPNDITKSAQEVADEEEEEKYGPSAPMQRLSFPAFPQYKDTGE